MRAVVGLEPDHLGVGERLLEVGDVLARGAAEAVDRLVVVAHHDDVAVLADQQLQQLLLREVGVLVLVDEHGAVALAEPAAGGGMLVQQPDRAQDHLAEVERAGLVEQPVVVGVDARELHLALGAASRSASSSLTRPARAPSAGTRPTVTISSLSRSIRSIIFAEDRRRVAAHVVVAHRQLVEVVHQQRQPVGRRAGWKNGSKPASSASSWSSRAQNAWNVEQTSSS